MQVNRVFTSFFSYLYNIKMYIFQTLNLYKKSYALIEFHLAVNVEDTALSLPLYDILMLPSPWRISEINLYIFGKNILYLTE